MICGDAFNIIPLDDPTQEMTPEERTNTWYETMIRWQRMDFASELVKLLLVAWREDSVYASGDTSTTDTDPINGGAPSKDSDDLTDSGSKSKERGNE